MRISFSDEEDRPGQFALWNANCRRSIAGRKGQAELRELEAALMALPSKRLIRGSLTDEEGGVCAIACYAQHKGVDLSAFDPEDESDEVGIAAGMPRLVAWKVVELNDIQLDTVSKRSLTGRFSVVMVSTSGIPLIRDMTPEERYTAVLQWVRQQLKPEAMAG